MPYAFKLQFLLSWNKDVMHWLPSRAIEFDHFSLIYAWRNEALSPYMILSFLYLSGWPTACWQQIVLFLIWNDSSLALNIRVRLTEYFSDLITIILFSYVLQNLESGDLLVYFQVILIVRTPCLRIYTNRPFPCSKIPRLENEAKCKTFQMKN